MKILLVGAGGYGTVYVRELLNHCHTHRLGRHR